MSDRPGQSGPSTASLLAEAAGVDGLVHVPILIAGVVAALGVFMLVGALLALPLLGLGSLLEAEGALAAALGIGWLIGSLAITAVVLMALLVRVETALARRWPTRFSAPRREPPTHLVRGVLRATWMIAMALPVGWLSLGGLAMALALDDQLRADGSGLVADTAFLAFIVIVGAVLAACWFGLSWLLPARLARGPLPPRPSTRAGD